MYPSDIFQKKILISPINWGMGHVSRCIPLIKILKKQNNQIYIACSESQRNIFESYFDSEVIYIQHNGYPFSFKGYGNFISDTLLNIIELKKRHDLELSEVNNLISKYGIEIVVSDHRYGFRSKKCLSIFMTHQLQLPLPWYSRVFQFWHKNQIDKFDYQWIVDDQYQRLAGKLSDNTNYPNSKYIGFLSRLDEVFPEKKKRYKGVLIISGPFEYYQRLFQVFRKNLLNQEIDLIIGNQEAYEVFKNLNLDINFHCSINWKSTDDIISQTEKVFGYFGYTTLMDIKYLKCEADLIACPGQLEQLYLQQKSPE